MRTVGEVRRTVVTLKCLALCAGDEASRGSLQAQGMARQAEAKALERGAHQSPSQLSLLLSNPWGEEIKGRGVVSLTERVNVLCWAWCRWSLGITCIVIYIFNGAEWQFRAEAQGKQLRQDTEKNRNVYFPFQPHVCRASTWMAGSHRTFGIYCPVICVIESYSWAAIAINYI